MKKLLVEPHYLGSIEYFCLLQNHKKVEFEICDSFQKQTYRNRSYVLGSNKVVSLNIPLKYTNGTPMKDVKIDYSQRWIKDHWGAIYSSYGKAPFFEFFAYDFKKTWEIKSNFLIDLNMNMLSLCLKCIDVEVEVCHTDSFQNYIEGHFLDARNIIQPKIGFYDRNIYYPATYSQLFGDSFVPNLSIIDLIMCEGPRASEVLALSHRRNK